MRNNGYSNIVLLAFGANNLNTVFCWLGSLKKKLLFEKRRLGYTHSQTHTRGKSEQAERAVNFVAV